MTVEIGMITEETDTDLTQTIGTDLSQETGIDRTLATEIQATSTETGQIQEKGQDSRLQVQHPESAMSAKAPTT